MYGYHDLDRTIKPVGIWRLFLPWTWGRVLDERKKRIQKEDAKYFLPSVSKMGVMSFNLR